MKPKTIRMALLAILIALAAPFVVMAFYVEDWSRDLSQNRAHTTPGGRNEPIELRGVTASQVAAAAEAMNGSDKWRLANEEALPDDSPLPALLEQEPADTHHFVRSTGLMGFKDDVWMVVTEQGNGVVLFAESRSRVGKGDLGQNPRNLDELAFLLPTSLDGD